MEGLQRENIENSVNINKAVSALVGENEKVENQLTAQNEPDMSKDMAEQVADEQLVASPEKVDECIDDKIGKEELSDSCQLLKADVARMGEYCNTSITEDILSLFPFVCGICDEKFNNLTSYFMHISMHESMNTFLHCCDLSNGRGDKKNVFFSCGICDIKYPTLCTLYKHLLETEGVTDFVYRDRERTVHAYNHKTKLSETPENINNYRFRKRSPHTLNENFNELDCPKNITELDTTVSASLGKQCIDEMYGNSEDQSDSTIINENIIKDDVEFQTMYVSSSKDTVKNGKKSQKAGRKRVIDKKASKTSEKDRIKSRRTGTATKTTVPRVVDSKAQKKLTKTGKYLKKKKKDVSSNEVVSKTDTIKSLIHSGANMVDVDSNVAVDVRPHVSDDRDVDTENDVQSDSHKETVLDENEKNVKTNQLTIDRKNQLFPCEICGAEVRYQYLKRHKTTHEERTLACDQCDNVYNCKHKLRLHKKQVHTDEKKFICDECGKSFKAWPYLKQHRQVHIKERNILCPACPMKFKYAAVLRAHMKIHLDQKPYTCDECGMKFKRADLLTTHKKYHLEDKTFSCPECSKMFKLKQDMKKHYKIHLPPKFFCEICGKSFIQKYNMRIYMKTHGDIP